MKDLDKQHPIDTIEEDKEMSTGAASGLRSLTKENLHASGLSDGSRRRSRRVSGASSVDVSVLIVSV